VCESTTATSNYQEVVLVRHVFLHSSRGPDAYGRALSLCDLMDQDT